MWITYFSGLGWIFGWIVMIPLGGVIYTWLYVEAFFISIWAVLFAEEGVDLWKPWMMGPVRRAIVGSFIYGNAVAWSSVPVVNFGTSILFGYWAVWDYYDYNFDWETYLPTDPTIEM